MNIQKCSEYLKKIFHKSSFDQIDEIMNMGERVTHIYPNDCYYGHLSIYYFALQFCKGATVLDAGSGAGYGSAYLVNHGANFVYGIDADEHAVKFSKYHFKRKNLKFKVMDIQEISGFPSHYFDFIYTSNTLEHLSDIPTFIHKVWRLLKPQGTMLIAIPPIVNEEAIRVTLANPHHVNAWSPKQWYNIITQYFSEVQVYRHDFEKEGIFLDFNNTPAQTVINEKDFVFKPVSVDDVYKKAAITVIFVMRKPCPENELPFHRII